MVVGFFTYCSVGFRFSIKCGIAGGTLYYLAEEGVWKNSVHTEKVFNKIIDAAAPYAKDASKHLPVQVGF